MRPAGTSTGLRFALGERLVGTGATSTETALVLGSAVAAAVALPLLAWFQGAEWSAAQWLVAAFLAGDLVGGVAANASPPARRYYFRADRTRRDHLTFVAVHLVHVAVFTWLFLGSAWEVGAAIGVGLMAAAALILSVPVHLRRAAAMLCLVVGIVAAGASDFALGMEWFVPVLLLKLLVCYLLGDVPAAPSQESA